MMLLGLGWIAVAAAWSWSQHQYFVGVADGQVAIYRGINASLPGITLHSVYETTDLGIDELAAWDADRVRNGIAADNLADAQRSVDGFAQVAQPTEQVPGESPTTTRTQ